MLIKLGVDVSRLKREVRRRLTIIEFLYRRHSDSEAVITSTYEGDHSPGSLHYSHDAIDFRSPDKNGPALMDSLKKTLGSGFDVITEKDHIHIEYDPK